MQTLKTRNGKTHTLAYGEYGLKSIMVRKGSMLVVL